MTTPHQNPFVLPGMGQSGDAAGNPLLASMEMMRNAWSGLTGPGGLAQSLPASPPMNLEDLERRIGELRSIESWLRMNLSMLSSTIQGREVQRSTIATLRSFVSSVSSMQSVGAGEGAASPLEIVLGLKPAPKAGVPPGDDAKAAAERSGSEPAGAGQTAADSAASASAPAAGSSSSNASFANPFAGAPFAGNPFAGNAFAGGAGKMPAAPAASPGADSASPADTAANMAQAASQAWWDMLQQQFNQIASATTASMPAPPAPAADTEAGAAHSGAKADKSGFDPDLPSSAATQAPSVNVPTQAKSRAAKPAGAARTPAGSAGRAAPAAASKTASKKASKTAAGTAAKAPGKTKAPLPPKSKS
jgi:hypothetical protein